MLDVPPLQLEKTFIDSVPIGGKLPYVCLPDLGAPVARRAPPFGYRALRRLLARRRSRACCLDRPLSEAPSEHWSCAHDVRHDLCHRFVTV